jgi:tetratricopeptide (TPR) repeat protein
MATKKKASSAAKNKKDAERPSPDAEAVRARQQEAYEKLVGGFAAALETFNQGDLTNAMAAFDEVASAAADEPVLRDRARSYSRICAQRLAPSADDPASAEERYYRAVLLINEGQGDEALSLLDHALREVPTSAKYLYARASAWAIQGKVESAVSDLRQAISVDPQIRFQATNDPDFESIREEPAFIDIIEPTPSGA